MCALPVWCVMRGRCVAGIRRSAAGSVSFSTFAPRLPPTTSSCSGPLRAAKRSAGAAMASISARTGLPVTTARLVRAASAPSKPKATRSATGSSALLLSSSAASALTSSSGLPSSEAIIPPGKQT